MAATELIATRGIRNVDLRKIADRAGTSLSQVYQHYKTRERLLVAVFQRGWTVIEREVRRRAFGADNVRTLAICVFEGLLDAYEQDRLAFSAVIILASNTFDDSIRSALKESDGFSAYRSIGAVFHVQLRAHTKPEEVNDILEFLFGAVLRRLLLLSPLLTESAGKTLDYDRIRITTVFTRMLDGFLMPRNVQ